MEDYYPDETLLIMRRQAAMNKKRDKEAKKEKVEEVYADQFF